MHKPYRVDQYYTTDISSLL